jgi:hypothetical protein
LYAAASVEATGDGCMMLLLSDVVIVQLQLVLSPVLLAVS